MYRLLILGALPAAAAAQNVPSAPTLDAARAAARQVDQATQAPRTGKEAMDRVTPLLTVEPPRDPGDEKAWRQAREAEAKRRLEASEPN